MKNAASRHPSSLRSFSDLRRVIAIACCLAGSLMTSIAQSGAQPGAQPNAPAVENSLSPSPPAPAAPVSHGPPTLSQPAPASADGVAVSVNVGGAQSPQECKCTEAAYDLWGKLAWPITVLILGGALALNRKWLKALLGSLRRVKAGEVEFEFNAEDALRAKISINDAYEEFRKTAQVAYAHFVRVYSIRERFEKALAIIQEKVKETLQASGSTVGWPEDFRATVHVPDVVLSEFTYQLLDYLPRGDGKGRRFSSRRGILGRSWRLERSLGMGNALVVPASAPGAKPGDKEDAALITEWGMTRAEAASWRQDKRHSFLCIIVRSPEVDGSPGIAVGVLYVDSKTVNGFGTDTQAAAIAEWAESQPTVKQLGEALSQALQDLKKGGTFLDFSR